MLSLVLGVAAVTSTVLRSWPQFVRVLRKHSTEGVSILTWMLMLNNHSAWTAFGVLQQNPVLIIANALALIGCAAVVWRLDSARKAVIIAVFATLATIGIYLIDDSIVLALVVSLSLAMFVPQMIKVFTASPVGVSVATWVVSVCSSLIWISWAASINHVTLASAHFVMGPIAAVIAVRAYVAQRRAHRHVQTNNVPTGSLVN